MNKKGNSKTNNTTLTSAGLLFLMLVFGGGIRQVGYAFDNAQAKETSHKAPDNASKQIADAPKQDKLYYLPF